MVSQIASTVLIVSKLWSSRRPFSRRGQMGVIWMIIESGAILTACTLTVLVLFLLNFNAGQIVTEIEAQLSVSLPLFNVTYEANKEC